MVAIVYVACVIAGIALSVPVLSVLRRSNLV